MEVPKFESEGKEAKWWYANRDKIAGALIKAMDNGTVQRGLAERLTKKARASRNVTLRLMSSDLDLARTQAEERGLPYQTYIKSLLHEVLTKRDRSRAR